MTLWQPGMIITEERMNDGVTPEIVTTGLVGATDFTVVDFYGSRSGRSVMVHCYLTYTGASYPAGYGGIGSNWPDLLAATLPTGWRPPTTMNTGWGDGINDGECTIGSSGQITLRSAFNNMPTGRNLRITAQWNAA
ncbi:hypothetical protein IGX29_05015 [Streptomyces sp. H28]|uniref:hypothetical protein n=1 Tax=Streptomyces sp. H28 TaxID=2775865 RepID=UPI00177DF5DE|nr:hypothetical protein [Streptomyces sp. H28]MBD9731187.1 hypothetical protein [Streptomyces sp. H28]